MNSVATQVNVRLSGDDLELLDTLRHSAGGEVSRAEVLRSLLREKRRAALDVTIAEAYDAAAPGDNGLGEGGAQAAGEALKEL